MEIVTNAEFEVPPDAILSGIGNLDRRSLCILISVVESVDLLGLVRDATEGVTRRLGLSGSDDALRVNSAADALENSDVATPALRHRLWYSLCRGLSAETATPYTSRSAHRSAVALAVRTSERLSPELHRRRQSANRKLISGGILDGLSSTAGSAVQSAKAAFSKDDPLPFSDIVTEEFLDFLNDDVTFDAIAEQADTETRNALGTARTKAHAAIAGGTGWAVFAGVVASSGFAPYILAAKASAVIPLVSGPGLVSLLAVLVNPATLVVGLGGLAWLGAGKSTSVARSQVAARLCVMLAMQGYQNTDKGLTNFVGDMRACANSASTEFGHLDKNNRRQFRSRIAKINKILGGPLPAPAGMPPKPWDENIYHANEAADYTDLIDVAAVAALTSGQLLWHAVAIDRNVLHAADFSRSIDVGNPLTFAVNAHEFALQGAQISLRGFTAERFVMDRLVAVGHDVVLPVNSNMPGFDLLVDGAEIQIKCGKTLGILAEHFEKYPGIPVIANSELAQKAWEQGEEWASLVTTLPGFDLSAIEGKVASALDHASELVDLNVLLFAFAVGLVRGGVEVWRGTIPLEDLPAWMLIDGAARGALGFAGSKSGVAIGLLAIGPAGAVILGPVFACAALMGTGTARNSVSNVLMRKWHKERHRLGSELHASLRFALERKIGVLSKRLSDIPSGGDEGTKEVAQWLRRKACDDLISVIEDNAEVSAAPRNEFDVLTLLVDAPRLAPTDAEVLIARGKLERHLRSRPGLNEAVFGKFRPKFFKDTPVPSNEG